MNCYYPTQLDFALMDDDEIERSMASYPTETTSTSFYHDTDATSEPAGSGAALQWRELQYYSQARESYVLQPVWPLTTFQQPEFQITVSPLFSYHDGPLRFNSEYSRSPSFVGISPSDTQPFDSSRSLSPPLGDLSQYGYQNKDGSWSCSYPGCTSQAVFTRGCDLRKHYKRHTKSLFCQHKGCPRSHGRSFGSKNDLARHEAKHNPRVLCEWEGCQRVFSRADNMRDHIKRIHLKAVKQGVLCEWEGCQRVYSRVDNMRSHMKKTHLKTMQAMGN